MENINCDFWLPASFPPKVKVIVTVEEGSKEHKLFLKRKCEIFKIDFNNNTQQKIIKKSFQPIKKDQKLLVSDSQITRVL